MGVTGGPRGVLGVLGGGLGGVTGSLGEGGGLGFVGEFLRRFEVDGGGGIREDMGVLGWNFGLLGFPGGIWGPWRRVRGVPVGSKGVVEGFVGRSWE